MGPLFLKIGFIMAGAELSQRKTPLDHRQQETQVKSPGRQQVQGDRPRYGCSHAYPKEMTAPELGWSLWRNMLHDRFLKTEIESSSGEYR